jgi:DNA helicase-2/ATP-dependent DNA helicase PcrA
LWGREIGRAEIVQTVPGRFSFAVGDRISHPQFGDGTITAIEGPKLSIAFDTRGEKQIIDSYVKRLKR